ncbi:SurE domain-containing protein [Mycena kentingensis (nom. inval.)]|nr:SurE domain-containing protein [Mycena kentingensis (nom. inval.)]
MPPLARSLIFASLASIVASQKILLTNDDGWAVAIIRAQENALNDAGYDVVLSCPAINKSGTGSSTATPTPVPSPGCEFSTCPTASPATGFNATNPRENYVNAFPVDSARFGIQTLSPKFFGSPPDFVVSGPNVGSNVGSTVLISGTVGAAIEAALEGFPAIAFSSATGSQVSYTTLDSDPTSTSTRSALVYSQLAVNLVDQILSTAKPFLPAGTLLNVNFPSFFNACSSVDDFSFVLTRINSANSSTPPDVATCGTTRLPTESSVIARSGCFISVSVMLSSNKGDANSTMQGVVLGKLAPILTCSKRRYLLKLDNLVVLVATLLRYILEKVFSLDVDW